MRGAMRLSSVQAIAADIGPGPAASAADIAPRPAAARAERGKPRYLYGPVADFLCLGGASFLLLPVAFLLPEEELSPTFAAMSLLVANVVNHPHFAVSYQIFYQGFRAKAFGRGTDAALRARYVFAGIVVPVAFAAFLAYGMISGDARLLGYGANAMGFLVGWHYAKQGYGMLMVDAALKRRFFDAAEKKILLVNCYAVWALSWLAMNAMMSERALWGIQYAMLRVPPWLLAAAAGIAVVTTAMTAGVLVARRRADGGGLPVCGVVAYGASLYLWLLLMHRNALWLAIVPALHSLQYLAVATRYHRNRLGAAADADAPSPPGPLRSVFRSRARRRYAGFAALALALGFAGFWGAPALFQAVFPYDRTAFGAAAFLFVFWVFINVHHYFLDSVMWRSRNPDVREYLFA